MSQSLLRFDTKHPVFQDEEAFTCIYTALGKRLADGFYFWIRLGEISYFLNWRRNNDFDPSKYTNKTSGTVDISDFVDYLGSKEFTFGDFMYALKMFGLNEQHEKIKTYLSKIPTSAYNIKNLLQYTDKPVSRDVRIALMNTLASKSASDPQQFPIWKCIVKEVMTDGYFEHRYLDHERIKFDIWAYDLNKKGYTVAMLANDLAKHGYVNIAELLGPYS